MADGRRPPGLLVGGWKVDQHRKMICVGEVLLLQHSSKSLENTVLFRSLVRSGLPAWLYSEKQGTSR